MVDLEELVEGGGLYYVLLELHPLGLDAELVNVAQVLVHDGVDGVSDDQQLLDDVLGDGGTQACQGLSLQVLPKLVEQSLLAAHLKEERQQLEIEVHDRLAQQMHQRVGQTTLDR